MLYAFPPTRQLYYITAMTDCGAGVWMDIDRTETLTFISHPYFLMSSSSGAYWQAELASVV